MAVAVLGLLTAPVNASVVEDTVGFHYQDDGGTEHDAPDTCEALTEEFNVPIDAEDLTRGRLVHVDDEIDHFYLAVGPEHFLTRIQVSIAGQDLNVNGLTLDVLLPDCGPSVFSEEGRQRNEQNAPQPTEPPAEGEKTVAAHSLTGYECDAAQWHFVINQLGGRPAPDHIRVQWSNGDIENIPADQTTPATLAHYRTSLNLDSPVWGAHVNVFQDWDGRFNLGSGPCLGEATPPPAFEPPEFNGQTAEFTVTEPEPHVLVAILDPPEVVTQVPVDCHDLCGPSFDAGDVILGYLTGGNSF